VPPPVVEPERGTLEWLRGWRMTDGEKWSLNESLLQSYRSIFISSESFLLAVGAIVAEKNVIALMATALVSFFIIWRIWFPVVTARHRIVDYYKGRAFHGAPPNLCEVEEYVHDKARRQAANKILDIETNWRPTRKKIDLWTPLLFSAVWMVLIGYGLWNAAQ
jgi:hypothetical protein